MKDTEAFKATLAAKNEPNSGATPEQQQQIAALLSALRARVAQSETKPNS
ncbi:MAG: hypothetical protein HY820_39020 [Acidobacteria bacterium]|nr:hypothetical protein [Acidobacteriota bacterium]